jgi:hypothetical protein
MKQIGSIFLLAAIAGCSQAPLEEGPLDLGKADGLADAAVEPSVSDLPFEAGDWVCGDDNVQISVFNRGHFVETDTRLGDFPKDDDRNEIRIRVDGETHVFNKNVLISTDGAGNYDFQLLYLSGFEAWSFPLSFHTDHETLEFHGYYALPIFSTHPMADPGTINDFGNRVIVDGSCPEPL